MLKSPFLTVLWSVAALSAMTLLAAPAQAGADITNFKVKNCSDQRIFVCSFDKTDSLMKIPYKARGIQPGDKKEFGCASLSKCKVIIGVSKRKSKRTLSDGMETALATGAVAAAGRGDYVAVSGADHGLWSVAVGSSAGRRWDDS